MTKYEDMTIKAQNKGYSVKEYPFRADNGLIKGNLIGIRTGQTTVEKTCILAEEIAHAELTVGNILDQSDASNRKQEYRARVKAYNDLVDLDGLIEAHKHGCQNRYEAAEFLEVTEQFLQDTVDCYRNKYGVSVRKGNYLIIFEPSLAVVEFI